MKALVIYDSVYGNTEKIARAVGAALGTDVPVLKVSAVTPARLSGIDILFVGSPTVQFRALPGLSGFLANLAPGSLKGVKAAAFDTRVRPKFVLARLIVDKGGYADKLISAELTRLGADLPIPSTGFIVQGKEGPLHSGELERAAAWAATIL